MRQNQKNYLILLSQYIWIAVLCSLTQGCVGHMEITANQTHSFMKENTLAESPTTPFKNQLICPIENKVGYGQPCDRLERLSWSTDKLEKFWGKPYKTTQIGNEYCHVYHRQYAWRGNVIGGLLIPIPLLTPFSFNDTSVCYEGGKGNILTHLIIEETVVANNSFQVLNICEPSCPRPSGNFYFDASFLALMVIDLAAEIGIQTLWWVFPETKLDTSH